MPLTQDQVTAALKTVLEPELQKDLVTLGLVKNVRLSDDDVEVTLDLASPGTREAIETNVAASLKRIGAAFVKVVFVGSAPAAPKPATPPVRDVLPQVKHIIAVGAGKGGVGKSTVAVNLAVGLQRRGHQVGLMDGDIYGPSMPTMLGLAGLTPSVADIEGVKRIRPLLVHGIHAITIGSLVEAEKPLMWRGPMAHGAFKQLLLDNTHWPTLDYLIVDLPPGTGDVPITLCQLLPLTGAIIVATPQQVALDDAIRAARMFQQLGAPILGVVENMSYFVDPSGVEHDIFGRGGTKAAADRLGLPMIAEIPMFPELRVNSDAGKPHANFEKNPALKQALEQLAQNTERAVEKATSGPGIELTIE
jgi:ATP-binding protein involved in chromosome partitioning